jgi:hypothetical protein
MTHDYKKAQEWFRTANWHKCVDPMTAAINHALELAIALQPKPISELEEYSKNKDRMSIIMSAGMTHFYDILGALPKIEEV